jgi:hypothetical protein
MTMALIRVEPDFTAKEADEWVYEFVADLFEHLEFDKCVGLVNGELVKEELQSQVFHMAFQSSENLTEAAIHRLTD